MTPSMHRGRLMADGPTRRDYLTALLLIVGPTALIAAAVAALFADTARDLLPPLGSADRTASEIAHIGLNNIRIALVLLVLAWLAGSWRRRDTRTQAAGFAAVLGAAVVPIALSTVVIGTAIGAYPAQILTGVATHAPLEIGALALALSAVIRSCRAPDIPVRTLVQIGVLNIVLLSAAAVLEVLA